MYRSSFIIQGHFSALHVILYQLTFLMSGHINIRSSFVLLIDLSSFKLIFSQTMTFYFVKIILREVTSILCADVYKRNFRENPISGASEAQSVVTVAMATSVTMPAFFCSHTDPSFIQASCFIEHFFQA